MRSIWITRHGNRLDFVDPNWVKCATFPFDPPLSSDGIEQARQTAAALQGTGISRVVSSPFLRCIQTAVEIVDALDVPIVLEWGLSEWFNPCWFPSRPELVVANRSNRSDPRIDLDHVSLVRPEFPETKVRMYERVALAARLLIRAGDGDELWVGHGASVQGSVAGLLGVTPKEADEVLPGVPCCCLTRLVETPGGWSLERTCDTSHLSEVTAANRFN
ncbi:MAG: histidine phosphatase family protein [Acidobacteriota bacterium]